VNSLTQIQSVLKTALKSPALFSLVNTRVMLRTGVDLGTILPRQDHDRGLVDSVLRELKAMGYSEVALQVVAKKDFK
jgi:hypothetical protein